MKAVPYEVIYGEKERKSLFIRKWKETMHRNFKMKYAEYDVNKLDRILDIIISMRLYNPKMRLVNNYRNRQANTTFLDMYEYIETTKPIIGGNGVLFKQHKDAPNPLIDWIALQMNTRKKYKDLMFDAHEHEEFDLERLYDLMQGNTKIKINSLYGVLGYCKFMFYNLFLAQCVTITGQNIISTAACGFEAFLTNSLSFVAMPEVRDFFYNCQMEASVIENNSGKLGDYDAYPYLASEYVPFPDTEEVVGKILRACGFKVTKENEESIISMVVNSSPYARKLLRYKNDLIGLMSLPHFREEFIEIIPNMNTILVPKIKAVESEDYRDRIITIWNYIDVFVMYKYPIYDRVRRNKYQDKSSVMYEDTDSNFLSLNRWVQFVETDILNSMYMDNDTDYKSVNILGIYLSNAIAEIYDAFGRSVNVDDEHRPLLNMKNEFYYPRILFVKKKKRYIGLQMIREGHILNNGAGKPDIKGFDFIKSTTKESIRKYYEDIAYNDILVADEIDIRHIFRRIVQLEQIIRSNLAAGDSQYFKQSAIKRAQDYATPYSIQGVKAVLIWNTLNPEYAIELPSNVDIVPINLEKGRSKVFTKKNDEYVFLEYRDVKSSDGEIVKKPYYMKNDTKNLMDFATRYPDEFARLDEQILHNENKLIRSLGLNYIAKPKNPNIPIPRWFYEIMDMDKIVDDGLKLFNPILETLGITIMKTGPNSEHYSNIISL